MFLYLEKSKKEINYPRKVGIMIKDGKGNIYKVSESLAWNWQQGCMQQWYPKGGDYIIFNDYDPQTDEYISKIIDKKGRLLYKYPKPVYSISPDGNFALTLNFDRVGLLRPEYGYLCRKRKIYTTDYNDGIWLINLNNGHIDLILSLDKLKNIGFHDQIKNGIHKVIHLDFSPDGKKISFLHRWKTDKKRYMRLITSNISGDDIKIIYDGLLVSHYCWLDSNRILAFCKYPVYGEGYYEFNLERGDIRLIKKLPKFDGHPSVSPDGKWLITDSYPDYSRMAKLYLYDINADSLNEIGRFFQPLEFRNENRVDLHPKWLLSGYEIAIESAHKGDRNLFILDLSKIVLK